MLSSVDASHGGRRHTLGFESKREIERERKVWKREIERGMSGGED